MKLFNFMLLACCFFGSVFAGTPPVIIHFNNGELFSVSLSKFNYNRIDVAGEKITHVRYTAGNFLVDQSDLNNPDDGAVYIKPLTDIAMTVFITTQAKHHFSMSVTPNQGIGKTMHFIFNYPKRPVKARPSMKCQLPRK